jgi:hypothetical protein
MIRKLFKARYSFPILIITYLITSELMAQDNNSSDWIEKADKRRALQQKNIGSYQLTEKLFDSRKEDDPDVDYSAGELRTTKIYRLKNKIQIARDSAFIYEFAGDNHHRTVLYDCYFWKGKLYVAEYTFVTRIDEKYSCEMYKIYYGKKDERVIYSKEVKNVGMEGLEEIKKMNYSKRNSRDYGSVSVLNMVKNFLRRAGIQE